MVKKKKTSQEKYKHIIKAQKSVQSQGYKKSTVKNSESDASLESEDSHSVYLKKDLLKVSGFVLFVIVAFGALYYFLQTSNTLSALFS